MKARITFTIGVIVTLLNTVELCIEFQWMRLVGIGIGLFFVFWGWKTGWIRNRNVTVIIGHIAVTLGILTTAYSVYQIPFLSQAPTLQEVLDMPLFWGLFTVWGGNCMITHGYCSCVIKMHEVNNALQNSQNRGVV